ncbi:TcdA/TcdB catalytic glycosyltransferase domain-containing protein [Streptomyces sp. NPDC001985]|uniref:WXG100-like domain-containing protein n=1 Tax=Streptomyces sp. NPDC001985 TaxID=3154406 RepID=UPI0033251322
MQGDIDPPRELAEMLAMVAGENWPYVSEMDLLRRGRALLAAAADIEPLGPEFGTEAQNVLDVTKGAGARAFRDMTERFARGEGSKPGAFPGLADSSDLVGDSVVTASNNVETAKITIIGMAALVFAELVAAAISMVITFGAAAAAGAALIKTTILLIRRLITQLIKSILSGALMMGGMNVMAQLIQVLRGHRDGFDFGEIGKSALIGAGAGAIGFGIGKGLGKVFGKGFGGQILTNTLTEGLTEHVLAKVMPLFDPNAKEDDPGLMPFVGGFFESGAEGLNNKAKGSNVFNKFNVPVPAVNIDVPNFDVHVYMEKGTSTGAPLPSPGVGLFSGKTGMIDPSTGTFIDPPADPPVDPAPAPAPAPAPGKQDPLAVPAPPADGSAPTSAPAPDLSVGTDGGTGPQPSGAPDPAGPVSAAPAPGPAPEPTPAPTPAPAATRPPGPDAVPAQSPGQQPTTGQSGRDQPPPVPSEPAPGAPASVGPPSNTPPPPPPPSTAPPPTPTPAPAPAPAPAPEISVPSSVATDGPAPPSGPAPDTSVPDGPVPDASVPDGPVRDDPPLTAPDRAPDGAQGPAASEPVPAAGAGQQPETSRPPAAPPAPDSPDSLDSILNPPQATAPAGQESGPAPQAPPVPPPPAAPGTPGAAPGPGTSDGAPGPGAGPSSAPGPSGASLPSGASSGTDAETSLSGAAPPPPPGSVPEAAPPPPPGSVPEAAAPPASPASRPPEQQSAQPGAVPVGGASPGPGGAGGAVPTGGPQAPAPAPGPGPVSPARPGGIPAPPPPPPVKPGVAPPSAGPRPPLPGPHKKGKSTGGAGSAGKAPAMVTPAPNPVGKEAIKNLASRATPVPLRTERFDPRAHPQVSTRPGLLDGRATLIRADISRFQGPNGVWIRDLTVTLPVRTDPAPGGLPASALPALEQQIQDILDAQVNTGYHLPRSGDQLHIGVELTPAAPGDGEAVTVTYSPAPGRSDQLNLKLHPPGASPAQQAKDAGMLLHEILHYTGLSDTYQDGNSLFRDTPDKSATAGIMAATTALPNGSFPLEYLSRIEDTIDSGPVLRDSPLPGGTPPGPPVPSAGETPLFDPSQEPPAFYESSQQLTQDLLDSAKPANSVDFTPSPQTSLLGPDLFGLRRPAPPPPFMAGHDYSGLLGSQTISFLDEINLANEGTPSHASMAPASLEAVDDWAIRHEPPPDKLGDWAPGQVPPLPAVMITPWTIHTIWVGGPLRDAGTMAAFRQNLALAADGYSGSAQTVLWTDVSRASFDRAKQEPSPDDSAELIEIRSMLTFARDHGIVLANVDEVFNSESPMTLHEFYKAEMSKQAGPGYAAASDILRLELMKRFGGMYIDGDNLLNTLENFEATITSEQAYAVQNSANIVGNSFLAMPKGHPFADVYLTEILSRYGKTQFQLLPSATTALPPAFFITPIGKVHRNSVMARTGPEVMRSVAATLGLPSVFGFPGMPGVTFISNASWVKPPPSTTGTPAVPDGASTLLFTQNVVQSLVRDLYNRNGDLHLTQADLAVKKHVQSQLVLESAVSFIAARPELAGLVDRLTDRRLESEGEVRTELSELIRNLFDFDGPRMEGSTESSWLGEFATPVRFQPAGQGQTTQADDITGALGEVSLNPNNT